MTHMIVAEFDNEAAARTGLADLKQGHEKGQFSLLASAILVKVQDERIEVRSAEQRNPRGSIA